MNNYINIFETETRGNLYDLNELQAKHLKDILKIKAEAARTGGGKSNNQEMEGQEGGKYSSLPNKYNKISQLEEELEEAKQEIQKLKGIIKQKELEFSNALIDFKRRETMAVQQRKKEFRRPQELESSESETSSDDEEEMVRRKAKEVGFKRVPIVLGF